MAPLAAPAGAVTLLFMMSTASAHFIWMDVESSGGRHEARLTFSEAAGSPGPEMLLDLIVNSTSLYLAVSGSARRPIPLTKKRDGLMQYELVSSSSLPAAPFMLEALCTFGIFGPNHDELLTYSASADRVTMPHDWFWIQDAAKAALEVTLRDPWMKGIAGTRVVGGGAEYLGGSADLPPGYECPPGSSTYQGDACVIAVVRFHGELIDYDVNVTTFDSSGKRLRASLLPAAARGVALIRVPMQVGARSFASVNLREPKPGVYKGHNYTVVDHWATTSMVLQR